MRIITRLNIGGPAIHTLLLTREMAALDYRTVLVAGSCEAEDGDASYPVRPEDSVRWVPELSRSVRPWRNLMALWRLWRLLRQERPAIVHTHTAMAGCVGRLAAVLSGAPVVVHTFHGNSLNEYFSRTWAAVFRAIEQLLAHFTDALCVVSPQQATELSAKFQIAPAHKFRVVPLGLELDDYFGLRPPDGDGPLTVGWFGRMVPVKNIALLAATIERTLQRGRNPVCNRRRWAGQRRAAGRSRAVWRPRGVAGLAARRFCRRWRAVTCCCKHPATKARRWR